MHANHHSHNSGSRRLLYSLALTSIIFFVELAGGLYTRSLALLSDSAHVFTDMFALGLSYIAIRAAALPANDRHTYGYHRLQVLAALVNAAALIIISVEILREAWERYRQPQEVLAGPMLVIAVVGLLVNMFVAWVLRRHDHSDLNTRSAFLHVLGDALASVGVIVAGVAIALTGKAWIDPLISAFISLLILFSAGKLLRETLHILIEGMPAGMTASAVADVMRSVPGVAQVHDLHIWSVSPGYVALSAHVLLKDQTLSESQPVMDALKATLSSQYAIEHTTIQFECDHCGQGAADCDCVQV
jgi:cobalt-zinc-cadmium efflux system protein